MKQDSDSNETVKANSVSITLCGLAASAINGIVAYIAVYFFKPLWEKIIKTLVPNQDQQYKNKG